jgi:hypothetical protein
MVDIVAGLIELVLEAGGIPGPQSLDGQRRARVVAGLAAFIAVLVGRLLSGPTAGVVFVVTGSIVGLWVLGFSLVDLLKEWPPVQWQSVMAIVAASAALAAASTYTLAAAQLPPQPASRAGHKTTAAASGRVSRLGAVVSLSQTPGASTEYESTPTLQNDQFRSRGHFRESRQLCELLRV